MLSMEAVLGVVNAKTRGGVSRTGEIEVQCPMGVCGHKKKPVYFSVNLERGQYNCFHCCSGCPYSGGIVDLFCLFNGLDPKKRQEANKALANALDGKPVESRVTLKYQPEPTVDVKSDEELDKVYRAVLNELTLKPEHRNNLLKRGLTNEVIDKCLYRSVPERWVSVFAKLKKRGISFEGVPGFYEKNGKTFSACSKSGFFIPYFNSKGQIVGMQIRFDKGDKRYLWFSSAGFQGGCSARNIASYGIPGVMPECKKGQIVYVTEGALKAHIACELSESHEPYIALAGVNCFNQWEMTCEYLKSQGITRVVDAFDSDRESNEHVKNALAKLYEIASRYGITMTRFNWGTTYKGVDDYYLAFKQGKVFRPFVPNTTNETNSIKFVPFVPVKTAQEKENYYGLQSKKSEHKQGRRFRHLPASGTKKLSKVQDGLGKYRQAAFIVCCPYWTAKWMQADGLYRSGSRC